MRGLIDELCAAADEWVRAELERVSGVDALARSTLVAPILEGWKDALRACYGLAKAERGRELDGDRTVNRFGEQGLHPFSTEWGRLMALEALLPGLSDVREKHEVSEHGEVLTLFVSPRVVRHEAYESAEGERMAKATLDVVDRLGLDRERAAGIFADLGVDPEALAP